MISKSLNSSRAFSLASLVSKVSIWMSGLRLARRARAFCLRLADIARPKRDLPLKVCEVHDIKIHKAEPTHARRCKIESQRRTQTPGPDKQDFRLFQLELPLHAHLGHDEMPAVA